MKWWSHMKGRDKDEGCILREWDQSSQTWRKCAIYARCNLCGQLMAQFSLTNDDWSMREKMSRKKCLQLVLETHCHKGCFTTIIHRTNALWMCWPEDLHHRILSLSPHYHWKKSNQNQWIRPESRLQMKDLFHYTLNLLEDISRHHHIFWSCFNDWLPSVGWLRNHKSKLEEPLWKREAILSKWPRPNIHQTDMENDHVWHGTTYALGIFLWKQPFAGVGISPFVLLTRSWFPLKLPDISKFSLVHEL